MHTDKLPKDGRQTLKSTGRSTYQNQNGKYVFVKEKKYQPIQTIELAFEGEFDEALAFQYRRGITAVKRNVDWFFIDFQGTCLDKLGFYEKIEQVQECGGNLIAYGNPIKNKGIKIINPSAGRVIFESSRQYSRIKLISSHVTDKDMFMIKAFWLDAWGIVDTDDRVIVPFKYTEHGIDKVSHQALREKWEEKRIDQDITNREVEAAILGRQEAEMKLFIMGMQHAIAQTRAQRARAHNGT
ncbi:MAG: hypothetical protein ACKN9J_00645 [Holophagaceae bacterium]|jgi:hypothetical protein